MCGCKSTHQGPGGWLTLPSLPTEATVDPSALMDTEMMPFWCARGRVCSVLPVSLSNTLRSGSSSMCVCVRVCVRILNPDLHPSHHVSPDVGALEETFPKHTLECLRAAHPRHAHCLLRRSRTPTGKSTPLALQSTHSPHHAMAVARYEARALQCHVAAGHADEVA
eukprot:1160142-Pelagomonas_calceolata.AAC.23